MTNKIYITIKRQHRLLPLQYVILLLVALFFANRPAAQPNITKLEYYIDSDPGWGKAKNIGIVPADDLADVPLTINFATLTQGVHIVGIRSKDVNGTWSLDNKWLFLKPYPQKNSGLAPKLTRVEYYFDTDPGYGNGTPLSIANSNNLTNVILNIDLTAFTPGVHIVGIRSQDSTGAWGLDNKWLFSKAYNNNGVVAVPKVTRLEYYIDKDPGWGNGLALPIVPNTNFPNVALNLALDTVAGGVHIAGIRALDENGVWGLDNKWIFLKPYNRAAIPPAAKITRIEYYLDTDPGYGNGSALAIVPSANIANLALNINTTPLTQGVHIVGIRCQDSTGIWGLDNKWIFLKAYAAKAAVPKPNIVQAEYYVNSDPGYGYATPITIVPGTDLANISFPVTLPNFNTQQIIGIRTLDENGAWSLDNVYKVTITPHTGLMSSVKKISLDTLITSLRLQYNPVHQQAVLLYTAAKNDRIGIRIVDNGGKTITTKQVNVYAGVNPITLETGMLAQGMYIVQTTGEKNALSVKMLKQ